MDSKAKGKSWHVTGTMRSVLEKRHRAGIKGGKWPVTLLRKQIDGDDCIPQETDAAVVGRMGRSRTSDNTEGEVKDSANIIAAGPNLALESGV
jgi:hypothetical protein